MNHRTKRSGFLPRPVTEMKFLLIPVMSTSPEISKRPHGISRDNILGITKPAIGRLLHGVNIGRISALIYDEIRSDIMTFLTVLMHQAIKIAPRRAIEGKEVHLSLDHLGYRPSMVRECEIPHAVFKRLVFEIEQNSGAYGRFTDEALVVLHDATENYVVDLVLHAQKFQRLPTFMPKDLQLAREESVIDEHKKNW